MDNFMKLSDAKTLYEQYYDQQYREFILNKQDKDSLQLARKGFGWIAVSRQQDVYQKSPMTQTDGKLLAIEKNNKPHGFLWKTTALQIRKGLRYGIVKSE